MRRNLAIFLCCALSLALLAGCKLAKADAGSDSAADPQTDMLIGVFVTMEPLKLPDGKMYATRTGDSPETYTYQFEGLTGFLYTYFRVTTPTTVYWNHTRDDAIVAGNSMIYAGVGGSGDSLTLEGTIYLLSTDYISFQLNPVYQRADGGVYVIAAEPCANYGFSEGSVLSQTLTNTGNSSVKISFSSLAAPEKVVILQMDAGGNPLSRAEYAPNALPDTLTAEPGAAYLIVETYRNGSVDREVVGQGAETVDVLVPRADGVFVKHATTVAWPG